MKRHVLIETPPEPAIQVPILPTELLLRQHRLGYGVLSVEKVPIGTPIRLPFDDRLEPTHQLGPRQGSEDGERRVPDAKVVHKPCQTLEIPMRVICIDHELRQNLYA